MRFLGAGLFVFCCSLLDLSRPYPLRGSFLCPNTVVAVPPVIVICNLSWRREGCIGVLVACLYPRPRARRQVWCVMVRLVLVPFWGII